MEADVLEITGAAEVFHPQDLRAGLHLGLGEQLVDLPAHHGLDEVGVGDAVHIVGADVVGIPEHRDPGGQGVHVFKAVGNENNGRAVVPELPRNPVQLLGLPLGQGGSRLVHDDDFRMEGKGLGDLHHLLLRHGQVAHDLVGVEVGVQLLQKPVGFLVHGLPLNDAVALFHVADEDVLRHGQVGIGGHMLVDGGNAGLLGVTGALEVHRLSVEQHFALVRLVHAHDDFDECGFSRAVLAHQRVDLAGPQIKLDLVQGPDAREDLGDAAQFQYGVGHSFAPFSRLPRGSRPDFSFFDFLIFSVSHNLVSMILC